MNPYGKALTGKFRNIDHMLTYDASSPGRDLTMDLRDNTWIVVKPIVVDGTFDWQGDAPLDVAPEDMIIYEIHVKGFTTHPSSGVSELGTCPGFIGKSSA